MTLTAIQDRILGLLSDGKPHTVDEVRECLWDNLSCDGTVHKHIRRIQRMLRSRDEDLIWRTNRKGTKTLIHVKLVPISL